MAAILFKACLACSCILLGCVHAQFDACGYYGQTAYGQPQFQQYFPNYQVQYQYQHQFAGYQVGLGLPYATYYHPQYMDPLSYLYLQYVPPAPPPLHPLYFYAEPAYTHYWPLAPTPATYAQPTYTYTQPEFAYSHFAYPAPPPPDYYGSAPAPPPQYYAPPAPPPQYYTPPAPPPRQYYAPPAPPPPQHYAPPPPPPEHSVPPPAPPPPAPPPPRGTPRPQPRGRSKIGISCGRLGHFRDSCSECVPKGVLGSQAGREFCGGDCAWDRARLTCNDNLTGL